jgi:hypothetical protein
MKTLKVLTAAAGVLLAVSASTLAASAKERVHHAHVHRGYNSYASGAYNYGPFGGTGALTPAQHIYRPVAPTGNLPYPDRPYGDPDSW